MTAEMKKGACLIRAILISVGVFVVASFALAGQKDDPKWQTAKVLDSTALKTRYAFSADVITTIKDTQLVLEGPDYAFIIEDTRMGGGDYTSIIGLTTRAISSRHHGCRFIVGEDTKYWQGKGILHVADADGKDCKVEIIRQERLPKK